MTVARKAKLIKGCLLGVLLGTCSLFGCGPGSTDYDEDIGDTGLRFSDTSPAHMVIEWHDLETGMQVVVKPSVLNYHYEDPYVFGFRQVVNWYDCDNNDSDVEFTDRYEFFVVTVKDAKKRDYQAEIFKTYSAFQNDLLSKKIDMDDIDDFHPDEMREYMSAPSPLIDCINPRLM